MNKSRRGKKRHNRSGLNRRKQARKPGKPAGQPRALSSGSPDGRNIPTSKTPTKNTPLLPTPTTQDVLSGDPESLLAGSRPLKKKNQGSGLDYHTPEQVETLRAYFKARGRGGRTPPPTAKPRAEQAIEMTERQPPEHDNEPDFEQRFNAMSRRPRAPRGSSARVLTTCGEIEVISAPRLAANRSTTSKSTNICNAPLSDDAWVKQKLEDNTSLSFSEQQGWAKNDSDDDGDSDDDDACMPDLVNPDWLSSDDDDDEQGPPQLGPTSDNDSDDDDGEQGPPELVPLSDSDSEDDQGPPELVPMDSDEDDCDDWNISGQEWLRRLTGDDIHTAQDLDDYIAEVDELSSGSSKDSDSDEPVQPPPVVRSRPKKRPATTIMFGPPDPARQRFILFHDGERSPPPDYPPGPTTAERLARAIERQSDELVRLADDDRWGVAPEPFTDMPPYDPNPMTVTPPTTADESGSTAGSDDSEVYTAQELADFLAEVDGLSSGSDDAWPDGTPVEWTMPSDESSIDSSDDSSDEDQEGLGPLDMTQYVIHNGHPLAVPDPEPGDLRDPLHRAVDPEGHLYSKADKRRMRMHEEFGHNIVSKRHKKAAPIDLRTQQERDDHEFRCFHTLMKEPSGDDFNTAFMRMFRHRSLPDLRPSTSTSHGHPSDAAHRIIIEKWVTDMLLELIEKGIYKPAWGMEYQAADRTVEGFKEVIRHFVRIDFSTKDLKFKFSNLREPSEEIKLVIMIDVDMRMSTTDLRNLAYRYCDASLLIIGPRPVDAVTKRVDGNGDTDAWFFAHGGFGSEAFPATYGIDNIEMLNNWNTDTLNNTVEVSRKWGRSKIVKNVCHHYNVTGRQMNALRHVTLLTPQGKSTDFYRERHGVVQAVVNRRLFNRLEADSLKEPRKNKWKLHEVRRPPLLLRIIRCLAPSNCLSGLHTIACGCRRYVRYGTRIICCLSETDWLNVDPRECIADLMLNQFEKFNPVMTLVDPLGNRRDVHVTIWCAKTVGRPLGNKNEFYSHVTLALAGSAGVSYRLPVNCWDAIKVRMYCEKGVWTSKSQIRATLKIHRVYTGTGKNEEARFQGVTDLVYMILNYHQPEMTVEDLETIFVNKTIGTVSVRNDDEFRHRPSVINTGQGCLSQNQPPVNRSLEGMAAAVHARQEVPQHHQATKSDKDATDAFEANMLEWAKRFVDENGPLRRLTDAEVIAQLRPEVQKKYIEVKEEWHTVQEFIKEALIFKEGKIMFNSKFLKAEGSKLNDVPDKDKPGRVITIIKHRLQLYMKQVTVPLYDHVLKQANWFGMRRPSEAAARMVQIAENCSAMILGDGSSFEGHYGEWTQECLMNVCATLFGDDWDPLQRDVYLACVRAKGVYTVVEDGEEKEDRYSSMWVMPSGIVWTTLANSIINYGILLLALTMAGMSVPKALQYLDDHACIGGDDQALGSTTLQFAQKFGPILTATAIALGFAWKTEICVPHDSKYAQNGLDDDGLRFDFTVNPIFLSRNFRGCFDGDLNSCHDLNRLFANVCRVEASKLPNASDEERIKALFEKILAYADSDGNSGDLFPKMVKRVHELLHNSTETEKLAAQLAARDRFGRYIETTNGSGPWQNEPCEWYFCYEAEVRDPSFFSHSLDDLVVASIRTDRLAVFPPIIAQNERPEEEEHLHSLKQEWIRTTRNETKITPLTTPTTPSPPDTPTSTKSSTSSTAPKRHNGKGRTATRTGNKNPGRKTG